MYYVEVAIAKQRSGRKIYTYHTKNKAPVRSIVKVPYGRKITIGIVVGVVKKPEFQTKELNKVLSFVLPQSSIELLNWLFIFYPNDYGVLTQLLLPQSFTKKPSTVVKNNLKNTSTKQLPKPTKDQKKALKQIKSANRVLLHGDTGSGKTRVFLETAQETLKKQKSVLIITPEIGLTPQLIKDIEDYLSAPVILTHSGLTSSARRKIWEMAINEENPVVYVGPRSALFLPFKNLGLVIADEAHDQAYKQTQSPRYQALHIAAKLASIHDCKLIYSTATPNITDYILLKDRGASIIRLTELAAGKHRSKIEIIDLTTREEFTQNQYLSDSLIKNLRETFAKREQSILFLNRRGSARLIQCTSCGWQALCPNCGIPLTYHHDIHLVRCHSCSHVEKTPSSCPNCESVELQFKNIGTKALVEFVSKFLPKARIMRFDTDNTPEELLHQHVDTIKSGNVDIVIGTQLITKGIDLPNLGFVGVINADTSLSLPDYRAEEQTFQQLYQVIGRVDRGHKDGKAIIQTRLPDHPVMQAVLHRSWEEFAAYELNKRRVFKYPPYVHIASFSVSKPDNKSAETNSKKIYENLEKSGLNLQLLGPSPSFFEKRAGQFTWHIIAKSPNRSEFVKAASLLPQDWRVDIDPINLL